jgi:hypothetical protein
MWLIYLRFDDKGKVKTYHISADNKAESQEVLSLAEKHGLTPTEKLVEYSVFYSQRTIKPKEVANFHFYSHIEFTDRWKMLGQ